MKKGLILLLLLFPLISYSQGRFLYKEGTANTNVNTIELDFYCWSVAVQNLSLDTLYFSTDANMNANYTIKLSPYEYVSISTYDGFNKIYIKSLGSDSKYKLIATTTGGRR